MDSRLFTDGALAELRALPQDMQAAFERIVVMIEANGLERMREPYVRHVEGRLWEMRLTGGAALHDRSM